MKLNIKSRYELLKTIRKQMPKPGFSFKSKKQYNRTKFKKDLDWPSFSEHLLYKSNDKHQTTTNHWTYGSSVYSYR